MIKFLSGVLLGILVGAALAVSATPHVPHLVGWDCVGASDENPIYADEEDDFPMCDEIKENRP